MICPNCQNTSFNSRKLNSYLDAKECSKCNGIWIPGYNYSRFLEKSYKSIESIDLDFHNTITYDSDIGKTCPDCGKAIIARKVGMGLDFYIERCDNCFGIYLDSGEWEQLSKKNLTEKINYVFSKYWQAIVYKEKVADHRKEEIINLLGNTRGQVVIDFYEWLEKQPERQDIKRYLI